MRKLQVILQNPLGWLACVAVAVQRRGWRRAWCLTVHTVDWRLDPLRGVLVCDACDEVHE